MQYTIRQFTREEYPLLDDFLYQAIFIPEGVEPPPFDIILQPELQVYTKDFGSSPHDRALGAVCDGKIVGAVWVRIMNDYGHIDDETPSFAISLYPEYRRNGIGTALMQAMLTELRDAGYAHASLSVQKANYASRMYRKLGFHVISENEEEFLMQYDFAGTAVRRMVIGDYEAVYELWLSCKGMGLNDVDDSREGIRKYLERNPDSCFVAETDGRISGVILAGHDGRRGFIYHTAVHPDHRGRGIGRKLTEAAMQALKAAGITKVALVVFERNQEGNAFWEKLGFTSREDLVYRNQAIAELKRFDT